MNTDQAIHYLENQIKNPNRGLPLEIFYFVSRLVPMVNVDLLIKDQMGRTLLAWRDDAFCGSGWHVPGGIVRYKERLEDRIRQVALQEIGTDVDFDSEPIAVNEVFVQHQTRGHFISFLYKCTVPDDYVTDNNGLKNTDPGYLQWHEGCPRNLVDVQKIYEKIL